MVVRPARIVFPRQYVDPRPCWASGSCASCATLRKSRQAPGQILSEVAGLGMAQPLLNREPMHAEETVSHYEPVLYARAMRLLRSRSDALDLVQDTYERALRG